MPPLRLPLLAVLLIAAAVPAMADPVAVRLTPEQVQAALASGEKRNLAAEALAMTGDDRTDRQLHGEFGVGVGTGGYNSVYGTVVAPLGDTGTAAFSFERTDLGRRNYGRGYYGGLDFGGARRGY